MLDGGEHSSIFYLNTNYVHEMNQIKYEHIYILQVINSFCYFQDTINIIIGNNHCICHQLNKIHYIRGVVIHEQFFDNGN